MEIVVYMATAVDNVNDINRSQRNLPQNFDKESLRYSLALVIHNLTLSQLDF